MYAVVIKKNKQANFGEILEMASLNSVSGNTLEGRPVKLAKGEFQYCRDCYNYNHKPVVVNSYAKMD